MQDTMTFEMHRPSLLSLAYRMLGDFQRAEDIVQDAWFRWTKTSVEIDEPKAFLIKVVTRLCLNELSSARMQREEYPDRLPEPIDLDQNGLQNIEKLDEISMAFLVLLQRLTSPERAVLLLHDVFDFDYSEVAELVGKSEAACRQLLSRAKKNVAEARRTFSVSKEEHRKILQTFLVAASSGDRQGIAKLLADDVVLVVDAGAQGSKYGRVRNLPGPLVGSHKVAAFLSAAGPQGAQGLSTSICELNGQPAALILRNDKPYTAIFLSIADDGVCGIYMQTDPTRLRHTGQHEPEAKID